MKSGDWLRVAVEMVLAEVGVPGGESAYGNAGGVVTVVSAVCALPPQLLRVRLCLAPDPAPGVSVAVEVVRAPSWSSVVMVQRVSGVGESRRVLAAHVVCLGSGGAVLDVIPLWVSPDSGAE